MPVVHGKIKSIKYIELNYPNEWEKLDIIPLSCFHIGSPEFNEEKLRGYIKWISERENRRTFLLGDIFDAQLTTSKGNMHEQVYNLRDAKLKARELLKPIRDHIDLVIPGNHDNYCFNETSNDIMLDLCIYLDIEGKYHFGDYTGVIRFGKNHGKESKPVVYTFYCTHGTGGATTPGGKINKLIALSNIVEDCDLYLMAHVHDVLTTKLEPFNIDSRNGKLNQTKQTFACSSSWLDYGGYAMEKKYRPAKTGSPRVRLYGYRKDIHVSI
jgi:UDP-2,3-diacylglucosamine pyrophosphatase LpxH